MKTGLPSCKINLSSRLPEIIIWITGMLIFIGIFFCSSLNAQAGEYDQQDTIWLKSGDVIPCKVAEYSSRTKIISLLLIGADGDTTKCYYPRKQIEDIYSENGYVFKRISVIPPAPRRTKAWVSPRFGSSYSLGIAGTMVFKNTLGHVRDDKRN
jgi:hypothetical protein